MRALRGQENPWNLINVRVSDFDPHVFLSLLPLCTLAPNLLHCTEFFTNPPKTPVILFKHLHLDLSRNPRGINHRLCSRVTDPKYR